MPVCLALNFFVRSRCPRNRFSAGGRLCLGSLMLFLIVSGMSASAQTYWLRYALTLGGDYSVGDLYDSGPVQNTSLLTTQLVTAGAVWTAKATPRASYGSLRLTAACALTNLLWNGNGHSVRFIPGGNPAPGFQDQLTVTSATLPVGTPVQFEFRTVIAGYIDPGVTVIPGSVYSSGSAFVRTRRVNAGIVDTPIGAAAGTVTITDLVTTAVGQQLDINSAIYASGDVAQNGALGFAAAIQTDIRVDTYVEPLTPGAGYTAASGTVYKVLPVALSIQATNGGAVLSWPAAAVNYGLEESPGLAPANWVASTNLVTLIGGTNQVTVSPLTGNRLYRLHRQ